MTRFAGSPVSGAARRRGIRERRSEPAGEPRSRRAATARRTGRATRPPALSLSRGTGRPGWCARGLSRPCCFAPGSPAASEGPRSPPPFSSAVLVPAPCYRRILGRAPHGTFASTLRVGTLEQGYPRRLAARPFGREHPARQTTRPVAVPRAPHRDHRGHVVAAFGWARWCIVVHTAVVPLPSRAVTRSARIWPKVCNDSHRKLRDRDGAGRMEGSRGRYPPLRRKGLTDVCAGL